MLTQQTQPNYEKLKECSAQFWTVRSLLEILQSSLLQSESQGKLEVLHSVLVELLLEQFDAGLESLGGIERELYHMTHTDRKP